MSAALRLTGLTIAAGADPIVEDVDLDLAPKEILGLVGESGSGKTTTARALLGYHAAGTEIVAGRLEIGGKEVDLGGSMRSVRGRVISYVPQDPGRSINPSLRIEDAIDDVLGAHAAPGSPRQVLDAVGLPDAETFRRRFPHQLSGGQQQRVCIGMALACSPGFVVLDEPTTGLDVMTQALILEELSRLRREQGMAMLYVTHDLAVVGQIADRIAVMYGGRIVEVGPAQQVLNAPRHPYTKGLLESIPDHLQPRRLQPMKGVSVAVGERPAGCAFAPRCPQETDGCRASMPELESVDGGHVVRCINWRGTEARHRGELAHRESVATNGAGPILEVAGLRAEYGRRRDRVTVAEGVDFVVERGSCVALVGESGSGKTTIARTIVGLHPIAGGTVTLAGERLAPLARDRTVDQRRRLQFVFQDPGEALNPRHDVRSAIGRPARLLRGLRGRQLDEEIVRLMDCVRLSPRAASRYPLELSGGERQRVALARALAAGPELIVCDEVTSALDVSVQAAVLELLDELRRDLGLSLVFITHDLGVVAAIADQVLVLERGVVCEAGETGKVLAQPRHPYTQALLNAAPSISAVAAA